MNITARHNHYSSSHTADISAAHHGTTMTGLLEPAVDGPPSPERIRQLSKQMKKRASHLNNHGLGHLSPSSSSTSIIGDRSLWENTADRPALSRHSSNWSAASGSPQLDRPESSQAFRKNLFHRRAKSSKSGQSLRDSSAHSSSGSSLYSNEANVDGSFGTIKDVIFSRRKSARAEAHHEKKLQISEPFNFQHISHTPRDQPGDFRRESPVEAAGSPDMLISAPMSAPSTGTLNSFPFEQIRSRDSALLRQSGLRRSAKHARSQEQLRGNPPPRPPRSPIETHPPKALPPIPPPRVSSRQSSHSDVPSARSALGRPQTSGGFRRPEPYSPWGEARAPPATSHGCVTTAEPEDSFVDDHRFSHAITTPDDVAWPLVTPHAPYEMVLPDVPEEEETLAQRRSRLSLISHAGMAPELPGCQPVPITQVPVEEERPGSSVSETLGDSDVTAQDAPDKVAQGMKTHSNRESWEDDIDYCYEHEADANFNYEWERPSMDVSRERPSLPVKVNLADGELGDGVVMGTALSSPTLHSPSRLGVPSVNSSGHAPPVVGQESGTPPPMTNNFSLPRGDRRPANLQHTRSDSRASSFKESHGFGLSPSLLIPGDYHHQLMLSEAERQGNAEYDEYRLKSSGAPALYEDNGSASNLTSPSLSQSQQRASVSTTATNSTSVTDSTGERHVSANSTWTSLTRLTSSTSLNQMAGSWLDGDRNPEPQLADKEEEVEEESDQESTPPASKEKDTVPELCEFPPAPTGRRAYHRSHASESLVRDEVPRMKAADAPKATRRTRARTASLNIQAPPVGQYALFPRSSIKGSGDRI